jgi:hypothetical protein
MVDEKLSPPERSGAEMPTGMTTLRMWAARHGRSHDYVRHWRKRPGFPQQTGALPSRGRHGGGYGEPFFDEAALDGWFAAQPDLVPPERIDSSAAQIDPAERITLGRFAGLIGKARGTVNQHRSRPGFPEPGPDGLYLAEDLLGYWNARRGRRGEARRGARG